MKSRAKERNRRGTMGFTPLLKYYRSERNRGVARYQEGSFGPHTNPFTKTGFTLLEVMVTLTILGVIVLVISEAFRVGLSAWERGESTRDEYQKVRAVSRLICQQIKSSIPYKIKTQKAEGDYLAFEGNPHSVKFVSALPIKAKQPQGFVYAIYEFIEGGKEGGRLVYYEQRVLNKNFFEERPDEKLGVSLLEGVSEVRFEYLRQEDPEKTRTEAWLDEWNAKDEKELPKALRVKITMKSTKSEQEEVPLTLLASISANRYEEVRTSVIRSFRPAGVRPGF
jgi:general secretion pathway protein J